MHVFVEPSGRRIEPFGDLPGDTPVLNRPLRAWQAEAFTAGGFTPIEHLQPPCLVVPDTLFATGLMLRDFVDQAAGRDAVLVLADSLFGKYTTPVQPGVERVEGGWRFEAIRFVSGSSDGGEAIDVVVSPHEEEIRIPVPAYYLGTDTIEMGLARRPLMTVQHWVHVLWVNQVAGGIEVLATPKWRWWGRGLWAALRAFSLNKWKVLGKLNQIGRGCDIHPTAVVEGSVLGDGVAIGPHARVRFSRLGSGTMVMPGAQVEWSVIGEKAIISQHCAINFCVLYPEAVGSQNLMQFCVLGRQCITTSGAFSMDLNFEGDIRVPLDGRLWSTGQRLIGSCFGHRSRIGTGFWMASGRMVPNDYFIVREPEKVLAKLPPGLADQGPLTNDVGLLVPMKDRPRQISPFADPKPIAEPKPISEPKPIEEE